MNFVSVCSCAILLWIHVNQYTISKYVQYKNEIKHIQVVSDIVKYMNNAGYYKYKTKTDDSQLLIILYSVWQEEYF